MPLVVQRKAFWGLKRYILWTKQPTNIDMGNIRLKSGQYRKATVPVEMTHP